MSIDYSVLLFGTSVISLSFYSYHKIYKHKHDIHNKWQVYKSKKKSEHIIKTFFKKEKEKYPGISLDDLILRFENSDKQNLEEYAESRNRNADSYRTIYRKFI